ncbi:MAG: hypothetical protein MPK03_00930 [Alphaproteobacteria bacterium]|nr:hypothetical protein [Alphaproteobacteria bacterium]
MSQKITADMLYNMVRCSHRPAMDLFGVSEKRDKASAFVRLLWERGTACEHEVIDGLTVPVLNLSACEGEEKERQTLEAMRRGEPLIYSARIAADNLLGNPDLLRREGDAIARSRASDKKCFDPREAETAPRFAA